MDQSGPPVDGWWLTDDGPGTATASQPTPVHSVLNGILSGFDEDLLHNNVDLTHSLASLPRLRTRQPAATPTHRPASAAHRPSRPAPVNHPQLSSSRQAKPPAEPYTTGTTGTLHPASTHPPAPPPARPASTSHRPQHSNPWFPGGPALVSLLLKISPPHLEHAFWRSNTWWQSVRGIDRMFFLFVLVNNGSLILYHNKLSIIHFPYFNEFAALYMVAALPLSLGATLGSHWYYRTRFLLVLFNRLLRLLHAVLIIHHVHACTITGACDPAHLVPAIGAGHPPPIVTLRVLTMTSGTFLSLLHTAYLTLPFPLHALLQTAYLAIILHALSLPAAHSLHHPLTLPSTTALCAHLHRATASFLRLTHALPLSAPLTPWASHLTKIPSEICTPARAPWILVLFSQSFIAFAVPLAMAYVLERCAKLQYLAQEARQLHLAPAAQWAPRTCLLRTAVLLSVYALVCWQLAVLYHVPLLRWVASVQPRTVDVPWYHELLAEGQAAAA